MQSATWPVLESKARVIPRTGHGTVGEVPWAQSQQRSFISFISVSEAHQRKPQETYVQRCLLGLRALGLQRLDVERHASWKNSLDSILSAAITESMVRRSVFDMLDCGVRMSEGIRSMVVKRYQPIAQVKSIYTDRYQEAERFVIFTANRHYDDELMEQLLNVEMEIRLATDTALAFDYVPEIIDNPNTVVPKDAILLYKRGYNVFFPGSHVASQPQQEVGSTTD